MSYYKNNESKPKLKAVANTVIACYRNDYAARKGLAAHLIDVSPVFGDTIFRVDGSAYEDYKEAICNCMVDEAAKCLEKIKTLLLEQALRHPIGWLVPLRNANIAFIDRFRIRSKPQSLLYPREIVAQFYVEHMSNLGYSIELSGV